jgi:hypothetical protein
MRLTLLNTSKGLMPLYPDDYEEKRKLKIGETYDVEVKLVRNPLFHNKYFALLRCAWNYLNEDASDGFRTFDNFREWVEMAAGSCNKFYVSVTNEYVETHKSINFSSMGEDEFKELYERVKDVLFKVFLTKITREQFEKTLINF